jgi:hypothetical protein
VSIQPIEAVYLVIILAALFLTFSALVDARADSAAVRLLNGKARELAAAGNVRREVLRIVVLLLLLVIALPGLFSDTEVRLTAPVLALIAIPLVLLHSTILDARDRRAMTVVVTADLLHAHSTALDRIEEKLNQDLTLNHAIHAQTVANFAQGEERAETADRVEGTVDSTATQVDEIHEATVHGEQALRDRAAPSDVRP